MALTPGRWTGLLLLILGIAFVALAPPTGGRPPVVEALIGAWRSPSERFFGPEGQPRDHDQIRLSRAGRVADRAKWRFEELQHREEAGRYLVRAGRDTAAVRVVYEGDVRSSVKVQGERMAESVRRDLGVTGTAGGGVVLVIRAGRAPRWHNGWASFPVGPPPGACVAVFELDSAGRLDRRGWGAELRLARCTYFAAFGAPGAGLKGVLDARRWDLTRVAGFTGPGHFAPEGTLDLGWWRSLLTVWTQDGWWLGREPTEIACQVGRVDDCIAAFRAGPSGASDALGYDWEPYGDVCCLPLQRIGGELVPDLVREFGGDAVRRWWQDDRPIVDGFEAATGRPLGEWLRQYVQRKLGRTLSGPVARWQSALIALLVCAVALGLATMAATRREVR